MPTTRFRVPSPPKFSAAGNRRIDVALVALLTAFACIVTTVGLSAQSTPPQLKLLVSEEAVPPVEETFGVPQQSGIGTSGNYSFLGAGSSSAFYRAPGSSAAVRLLQRGDPVPGIPGSRISSVGAYVSSENGVVALAVSFQHPDRALSGVAILTYNGTVLSRVITSAELPPDQDGRKVVGTQLNAVNDNGDVVFAVSYGTLPVGLTLYIVMAGGAPVKVLSTGDMVPGTTSWPITSWQINGFNNQGQVLFHGFINGGANGTGYFLGTTSGFTKVVIGHSQTGDPLPAPLLGNFSNLGNTPLLNNSGQVVFSSSNAIYRFTPGSGIAQIVAQGHPVPSPPTDLGGTVSGSIFSPNAMNDAGDVIFQASISGNSENGNTGYNRVLFRLAGDTLHSIAYATQIPPGTTNPLSATFDSISINAAGQVSFRNALTATDGPNAGFFSKAPGGALTKVALAGDSVPINGGGTFTLPTTTRTRTLSDGSVHFASDIQGGAAYYGEFLYTGGTISSLVNTAESLPPGQLLEMRLTEIPTAGGFAVFHARRTGGPVSVFRVQESTGIITRVVGEGDSAPFTNGGRLRVISGIAINAAGQVPILSSIAAGTSASGLYQWDATSGLGKVAVVGDVENNTGSIITAISANPTVDLTLAPPEGQILFSGSLAGSLALFVGSVGSAPKKVVRVGDPAPTGGTFSFFNNLAQAAINASGQVVFFSTTTGGKVGMFLGSGSTPPVKVVATGDAGPSASTFATLPTAVSLNNNGDVLFPALLNGGPGGGFFLGSASGPPAAVALNGNPAPSGGNFNVTSVFPDVSLTNEGDVIIRSSLSGGSSDSGLFIRRSQTGLWETIALQGDPAPGSSAMFSTMPESRNNIVAEYFSVVDGEVLFRTNLQTEPLIPALYRYRTNGIVDKVVVVGDTAPGGMGVIEAFSINLWGTRGPALWASVVGATTQDVIYRVADVAADLSIQVTGPSAALASTYSTYTVLVSNQGASTATNVLVSIPLPTGAQVQSLPGNCSIVEVITCSLASVSPDGNNTLEMVLRWGSVGQHQVAGTVVAAESDPNVENNASSAPVTVFDVTLAVQRSPRPGRSSSGAAAQTITFQISGAPVGQSMSLRCAVSGGAICEVPRSVTVSSLPTTFNVKVRGLRSKRLWTSRQPYRMTVTLESGELRKQVEVSVER